MRLLSRLRIIFIITGAVLLTSYSFWWISMRRLRASHVCLFSIEVPNAAGILVRADVRIAGIRVGWVDQLTVKYHTHSVPCAELQICIFREYPIYKNATATLRQDGIMGNRYIELNPGSATNPLLPQHSTIKVPGSITTADDVAACLENTLAEITCIAQKIQETVTSNQAIIPTLLEHTQQTLNHITNITREIQAGNGTLGKLLTDDTLYNSVCNVTQTTAGTLAHLRNMHVGFDMFVQPDIQPHGHSTLNDLEGYLDMHLRASENHEYILGVVGSTRGKFKRTVTTTATCTENTGDWIFECPTQIITQKKNSLLFNAQYGYHFDLFPAIGRLGIFQSSIGLGIDWFIPLNNPHITSIITAELFDLTGQNKLCDTHPRLKLFGRLFSDADWYILAGGDDILSKNNKTFFIGGGARFGCALIQ